MMILLMTHLKNQLNSREFVRPLWLKVLLGYVLQEFATLWLVQPHFALMSQFQFVVVNPLL